MPKTRHRVLLVDDDERVLRFLRLKLMASGFDVLTARSGQGALCTIESSHPDIVVLDLRMPGMGGIDLLKSLRRPWEFPVIIASAATDLAFEALRLGANTYLSKPFDPDELVTRIKALLQKE